jgi:hypothetical protein
LAKWVKNGGVLVFIGKDDDPYQNVMEWWDTKGNNFTAPSQHLFKLLGINTKAGDGYFKVGKGAVYVMRQNPKDFIMTAGNDKAYIDILKKAYEKDAHAGELTFKNNFYLQRGPYDVISVMDENADTSPYKVKGPVIDLFDPTLPVLSEKVVLPGEEALLYAVNRVVNKSRPQVLAAASRVYHEQVTANNYSFITKSPANTSNVMRILLPVKPKATVVKNAKGEVITDAKTSWDTSSNTLLIGFENSPDGVGINIKW